MRHAQATSTERFMFLYPATTEVSLSLSHAENRGPGDGPLSVVLLRYSGHGPLIETTRGLDRVVIGAIAVAWERP